LDYVWGGLFWVDFSGFLGGFTPPRPRESKKFIMLRLSRHVLVIHVGERAAYSVSSSPSQK